MFLIKKFTKVSVPSFLAIWALSSCQVSRNWIPGTTAQNFPMNHAPSRSAQYRPVAHQVPASSRVSVAATERRSLLGVPLPTLPSFGLKKQSAAIRNSRPTWTAPPATHYPQPSNPYVQVPQASWTPVSHPVQQPVAQLVKPQVTRQVGPPVSAPVSRPVVKRSSGTRGKVRLVNGLAVAPPDAPDVVRRAVAAGNRLQKLPYKWGGGHAKLNDTGYDCSGTVSYVLREAGLMKDQMTSRGFFKYGEPGKGEWITVWVRDGHVFMLIGDLRLDTGGSTRRTGPRWKTKSRSYKGLIPRHPAGL